MGIHRYSTTVSLGESLKSVYTHTSLFGNSMTDSYNNKILYSPFIAHL